MDTYQPIYDAVRSRLSNGDIGEAVKDALRCDVHHILQCATQDLSSAGVEMQRPSAVYRPGLTIDGNQWCALYGLNLQDGVAGFGDSPHDAMIAFDKEWYAKLKPPVAA